MQSPTLDVPPSLPGTTAAWPDQARTQLSSCDGRHLAAAEDEPNPKRPRHADDRAPHGCVPCSRAKPAFSRVVSACGQFVIILSLPHA